MRNKFYIKHQIESNAKELNKKNQTKNDSKKTKNNQNNNKDYLK